MILARSFKQFNYIRNLLNVYVTKRFEWSEFIFPSTLQLRKFLELLIEPVKTSETVDKIELGLHEALVNAVQHGNSGDPEKLLRVRLILTPKWFVWQIQDQGKGIPDQKKSTCLPRDIEANNGRGLFLINHCFDDVRWSRRGNRLQLATRRKLYY